MMNFHKQFVKFSLIITFAMVAFAQDGFSQEEGQGVPHRPATPAKPKVEQPPTQPPAERVIPEAVQMMQANQIGLSRVLSLGGVTKELEMSEIDRALLVHSWAMTQNGLRTVFNRYRENYSETLSDDDKTALMEEFREGLERVRKIEKENLESVLDSKQMKRLAEIRFQYLRRNATNVEELRERLELTDGQIKKFRELAKEMTAEIQDVRKDSQEIGLTKTEIIERIQLVKEEMEEKVLANLTGKQRQTLRLLEGDKFEFANGPIIINTNDDEEQEGKDKE